MLAIFNNILEMSLKASIVILAILVMRVLLRKAPKKFSYMLWSVAAFRLIMPFSFQSVFSIFNFSKDATVISQPVYEILDVSQTVSSATSVVTEHTASETTLQTANVDWNSIIENTVAWIWFIGMTAMLIYGIVSYLKIRRKMENAILIEGDFYCSDKITSPFTLGFINPKIYLPFDLNTSEQKCILAHEKAHIRRADHIIKPLAYILLSVHWFNPFCWIAFNRMGVDMEMSCDEAVLSKSDDQDIKSNYSKTLLALASDRRFPAPSPIAFNDSGSAKTRIKHALGWKKPKVWISVIAVILCAATLVTCMSDAVKKYELEFDDVPYSFTYESNGDGKCTITDIRTDFKHKENFEIVVPEKSPDGDTVVAIRLKDGFGFHKFDLLNVPPCFSEERFDQIKSKIESFEEKTLVISGNVFETKRAKELLESFYVYLDNHDSELYNASFYVLEPTLDVEEYNIISTILTHFADYTEEDCFEDCSDFCSEILKDENDEDMINRVFNYFYHSAKYVTKITVPQSVKLINDGTDQFLNDGMSIDYVIIP